MELQRRGYNVIEIWACDFKRLLDENWDLRMKWNKIQAPQSPLNPRTDALRGGRVEPFKLYEEAEDDELIEHYDVVKINFFSKNFPPIGQSLSIGYEDVQISHWASNCIYDGGFGPL